MQHWGNFHNFYFTLRLFYVSYKNLAKSLERGKGFPPKGKVPTHPNARLMPRQCHAGSFAVQWLLLTITDPHQYMKGSLVGHCKVTHSNKFLKICYHAKTNKTWSAQELYATQLRILLRFCGKIGFSQIKFQPWYSPDSRQQANSVRQYTVLQPILKGPLREVLKH